MDIEKIKSDILTKISEINKKINHLTTTWEDEKNLSEIVKNLSISYKLLDK